MEQWKQDRLIDILDTLIDYRGKTPNKVECGIPLITAKIVKNGRIETPTEFLTVEDYKDWMVRGYPQMGDVVITTEAPLGEVAQLRDDKIALAQRIVCLRGKEGVLDNTYLKYFLMSNIGQYRLKARETGTTVTGIKQSELKEVLIDYPNYELQQKIASILSSFDSKIELNRRINDNLEQQAQALFKAWFVDNAVIGDASVSDYFIPLRGKNLLTSDAKGGEVPVVAGGLTPSAYHNVANTKAPVITISASGANAGYVNLWGIPVWSADSSYIDSSITPHIYFWYNLLKFSQKNIFDSQTGSAQPHIYPKHIGDIRIPDLDLDKVADYNKIVTPIYEKITNTKKINAQLAETRDTLLPKLMSGELKIGKVEM